MENTLRTPLWTRQRERALTRDAGRCTVARLLGGHCHGLLHVHHIQPRNEGGTHALDNLATVCAHHHPIWEGLRRQVLAERKRGWRRCHHRHVTEEARRI